MKTETNRSTALREEIEALRHLTVWQLKERYREVFGESSRSNHKQFLFRRVAWRIQANAWGGLSERARRRALEIANDADLRICAPKNFLKQDLYETRTIDVHVAPTEDPRLPIGPAVSWQGYRCPRPRGRIRIVVPGNSDLIDILGVEPHPFLHTDFDVSGRSVRRAGLPSHSGCSSDRGAGSSPST